MAVTDSELADEARLIAKDQDKKYDGSQAESHKNEEKVEIDLNEITSERTQARTLTNAMVFIHLFKAFTGPSILGTPAIMKNGGLLFGPIAFILIGYLNNLCNITVVKCCTILCSRLGQASMTYEELVEQCFMRNITFPVLQKVAPYVRRLTTFSLAFTQFGLLSFYIQTIGTTAHEHLTRVSDDYTFPLLVTELFVALLLLPYSWMRSLKILSWFSLTANILTLVTVVTIIQYSCRNLRPVSEFPLITQDPWSIPLFVGATVFTVEGIPMVLPLENKAKNPQDYGGIITIVTTFNICLNVMVGFYGYMSVGESVTGNILVFLPAVGLYDVVTIAYAVAVFLTFTLQIYLPAEQIARSLKAYIKAEWIHLYADYIARSLLVIAAYLFAALVPKVELLMSLVGAFSTVLLVFIFPPLAELCVLSREPGGIPRYIWIKDVSIFTFGAIAFITGTYTSLRDIVLAF